MDNRQIDDELNQRLIDIIKNLEDEKASLSSEEHSFENYSCNDSFFKMGESTYCSLPYITDIDGMIFQGKISDSVKNDGVCASVRNIQLQCLTNTIVISWSALSGADGYLIYGQRNGDSYGYIGMTTGESNTTFTDTQASAQGMNLYYVFPFFQQNNQIIPGDVSVCIGGVAYLLDAP